MLTWQMDPLLVDPQPVVWQEWVTANQLLKEDPSRWSPRLFLRDRMLNFYGVMVRKSDFVKKTPRDRVLNRFPYLRLTADLRKIVKEECYRLGIGISQQ